MFTFAYPAKGIVERCAHDRVSVLMSDVEMDVIAMVTHALLFTARFGVQGIPFIKSHGRSRALELDGTELANLLVSCQPEFEAIYCPNWRCQWDRVFMVPIGGRHIPK